MFQLQRLHSVVWDDKMIMYDGYIRHQEKTVVDYLKVLIQNLP